MSLDRRTFITSTAGLAFLASATGLAQAAVAVQPEGSVKVRNRILRVGGRDVFYKHAGKGAPIVLIHSSPGDSSFWEDEIPELAANYSVYAFDSPGFGRSEPPPETERDVGFMAERIAAALKALGLPPAVIIGSHTGAAVGTELTVRHPQMVRGLMLDGIPVFSEHELENWFGDFLDPLTPEKRAGHFTTMWTRSRDQGIWFPWSINAPQQLMPLRRLAGAQQIQRNMMRIMRSARTYLPEFRSAVFYAPRVPAALAAIEQPTYIVCAKGDPLSPHMARLPPLKSNQTVEMLDGFMEIRERRAAWLPGVMGSVVAPPIVDKLPVDEGISGYIVELADGREVFLRVAGKPDKPALLLIHDAPGSSHMHRPLIEALSAHARVYAVDLPGCGETEPLSTQTPTIGDYAEIMRSVMTALGLRRASVHGIGFGSSVALELAARHPQMVDKLVLQSVLLASAEDRADMLAHYAPRIELKADGSHWYTTWLMLRDSLVFWPWYKATGDRLRQVDIRDQFEAIPLHDRTVEVMKQYGSYHHVINAALGQDAQAVLKQIQSKAVICTDARHPFVGYDAALVAGQPNAKQLQAAANGTDHVKQLAGLLGLK
ncbi:alpha/beta hydrolase [Povalibacter sp.]|uniref:alpha/beta hydrolase n=1 Tax=Povalibacter sp. TaxID=1962978 RepID=UPI002F40D748